MKAEGVSIILFLVLGGLCIFALQKAIYFSTPSDAPEPAPLEIFIYPHEDDTTIRSQ